MTPTARWDPPATRFVIKLAISGGSRDTACYEPRQQAEAENHVRRLQGLGQTVMVQPYVESVDHRGEMKMVFIGGTFSHGVLVGALLERHVGVVERPWEKPVRVSVETRSGPSFASPFA